MVLISVTRFQHTVKNYNTAIDKYIFTKTQNSQLTNLTEVGAVKYLLNSLYMYTIMCSFLD